MAEKEFVAVMKYQPIYAESITEARKKAEETLDDYEEVLKVGDV